MVVTEPDMVIVLDEKEVVSGFASAEVVDVVAGLSIDDVQVPNQVVDVAESSTEEVVELSVVVAASDVLSRGRGRRGRSSGYSIRNVLGRRGGVG